MKSNTLMYVAGAMVGCLAAGYFLGREHEAYAIKKAIQKSKLNLRARAEDAIDSLVDGVREKVHI
ncbi:MAG TPA: hypothetical protein VJ983_05730 [candidate division Zixibacteria bacterium]|nr:hypothetical protein [candidate division Zixibacteria bacterium]